MIPAAKRQVISMSRDDLASVIRAEFATFRTEIQMDLMSFQEEVKDTLLRIERGTEEARRTMEQDVYTSLSLVKADIEESVRESLEVVLDKMTLLTPSPPTQRVEVEAVEEPSIAQPTVDVIEIPGGIVSNVIPSHIIEVIENECQGTSESQREAIINTLHEACLGKCRTFINEKENYKMTWNKLGPAIQNTMILMATNIAIVQDSHLYFLSRCASFWVCYFILQKSGLKCRVQEEKRRNAPNTNTTAYINELYLIEQ